MASGQLNQLQLKWFRGGFSRYLNRANVCEEFLLEDYAQEYAQDPYDLSLNR